MHPEGKVKGIGIIRGFTPGKEHPRYGTAVCEMFGEAIHTQCWGKRTRGAYPEM